MKKEAGARSWRFSCIGAHNVKLLGLGSCNPGEGMPVCNFSVQTDNMLWISHGKQLGSHSFVPGEAIVGFKQRRVVV